MIIRTKRLDPLSTFGLIGFCTVVGIGSFKTVKGFLINDQDITENAIFLVMFVSILFFLGVLAFRKLVINFDSIYRLKLDKEKKVLNIKSKLLKRTIELDSITRVKLSIPQKNASNFNSSPLRDLDCTLHENHNNLLGGDRGATLYFYNQQKLMFVLKHIDEKSIPLVQKIVNQIDDTVGIVIE